MKTKNKTKENKATEKGTWGELKKKYIYIYNTNTGGYRKENKQEKGQVR